VRARLDEVMQEFDVHEVHSLWMPAPPADAFEAVKAVLRARSASSAH
jgi:hypothetical protein